MDWGSDEKAVRKQKDVVIVQASSAGFNGGNFAKITINDVPVEVDVNENNHDRGCYE